MSDASFDPHGSASGQAAPPSIDLEPLHIPVAAGVPDAVPQTVAIALVKNEGDMIAAWLSHLTALFDRVLVVDHASSDGTRDYLIEVAQQHGGIHVFGFADPGYFQEEITNTLAGMAARLYPEAWIFPLDADEFIAVEDRDEMINRISGVAPACILYFPWINCVPISLISDQPFEVSSPVLKSNTPSPYVKVAIHSSSILNKGYRFSQGNHDVFDATGASADPEGRIRFGTLMHVPIRSLDQFALKCIQGCLAYERLPAGRRIASQGFHWAEMVEQIVRGERFVPDLVRGIVATYGEPNRADRRGESIYHLLQAGWTCAPLAVAGGAATGTGPADGVAVMLPRMQRRLGFADLADRLIADGAGHDLQAFHARARASFDPALTPHLCRLACCADFKTFVTLPSLHHEPDELAAGIELLDRFMAPAATPVENPVPSTWMGHLPFLYCLMTLMRPRRFVELGSHYGNCFFAACQISRALDSATECVAIDTWEGDEHAGYYQDDVFNAFSHILLRNYTGIGRYIRRTFDQACDRFEPGSIDLLHIDGLHTYEAVSHDFATWLPKMSATGLVMFHDTQVHERGFGVWKFWSEVCDAYPSFEFHHGYGLGLLLVGSDPAPALRALMTTLARPDCARFARRFFSQLGEASPIRARNVAA